MGRDELGDGVGRLAVLSAELMEHLEGELPDGATIGEVMIVAEVHLKIDQKTGEYLPGGPEDHNATHVVYRCSDPRSWIHSGLLSAALRGATRGYYG